MKQKWFHQIIGYHSPECSRCFCCNYRISLIASNWILRNVWEKIVFFIWQRLQHSSHEVRLRLHNYFETVGEIWQRSIRNRESRASQVSPRRATCGATKSWKSSTAGQPCSGSCLRVDEFLFAMEFLIYILTLGSFFTNDLKWCSE